MFIYYNYQLRFQLRVCTLGSVTLDWRNSLRHVFLISLLTVWIHLIRMPPGNNVNWAMSRWLKRLHPVFPWLNNKLRLLNRWYSFKNDKNNKTKILYHIHSHKCFIFNFIYFLIKAFPRVSWSNCFRSIDWNILFK